MGVRHLGPLHQAGVGHMLRVVNLLQLLQLLASLPNKKRAQRDTRRLQGTQTLDNGTRCDYYKCRERDGVQEIISPGRQG